MATNPALNAVEKGDRFIGGNTATLTNGFAYESFVIKVGELGKRFGKEDRILTVTVRSIDLDGNPINIVDHEKLIWWSDANRGLV